MGGLFGIFSSVLSDINDNGSVDFSIGGWTYAGAIVGGMISGMGTGVLSTIFLSMVGSIVNDVVSSEFNPDMGDLVLNSLKSQRTSF